jgi:hypothetical protein
MVSRRFGRYLGADWRGRPQLDAAKVKAAEKFDGKFVVISNDDTLSAEDIALGYRCRSEFGLPRARIGSRYSGGVSRSGKVNS